MRPHQPIVTVVIPCLNRAHFLVPTIESVLQQDYANVECIVVDGGSTDGTVEILEGYGGRITWVSEPDRGHADAINKGWRMGRGEILAWLNADDVWVLPDAVSQAVGYLRAHPEVDLVYGDCAAIDAEGNRIGWTYLREWDLKVAVETCDHCIPQPAAFIRRGIIETVGWLDVGFASKKDHELWLRIGLAGCIRHIPVLLALERACPGYLAERGDITAAACVALTRKFFTLPGVPTTIRRSRAISNAYLRGMDYAWTDGRHWPTVFVYAVRATLARPSNMRNVLGRLGRCLSDSAAEARGSWWLLSCIELLTWPVRAARKVGRRIRGFDRPRSPNLDGDRQIERSWIASQMPSGPGEALDFGPGQGPLDLIAVQRDFNVTGVFGRHDRWPYAHPRLRFLRGSILELSLPEEHFDLVINCSSLREVGFAGNDGLTSDRRDGDLEVMARLWALTRPGGVMLLTVPVGRGGDSCGVCRVYGPERLGRLLDGCIVQKQAFWVKDPTNRWVPCDRQTALDFQASTRSPDRRQNVYALGCFVLAKPGPGGASR